MENLIFLLATSFVLRISTSRKFKNYLIGDTGCSALLFSNSDLEHVQNESGDRLYFTDYSENEVNYGIICIDLNEFYLQDEAEALLENYINKLRKHFFILHNTGLQPVMDWNSNDSSAFIDYWQVFDQKDWKIKGYTNGRFMAVLYVKNISQAEVKKQEEFLDSFHFGK